MKRSALLLLIPAAAMLLSSCNAEAEESRTVRVMLTENEHYTITSENPVLVPAGQNAVFNVEMEEDYVVTSLSDGATYKDGVITLPYAQYPTTIDTEARIPEFFWFEYRYSPKEGQIQTSLPSDKYMEGTEITVTAVPNDGCVFLGFSFDKYLSEGGTIVSTDPVFTFPMDDDITIYPNYVGADTFMLQYHGNGGTIDGKETAMSTNSSTFYYCPNTLLNKGQFEKEGHVLLGFNTEPDGSGEFYGPGWNVVMDEDSGEKTKTLYCQWVPVTPEEDFEVSSKSNVTIKGYKGDDEFVVIPETIGGKPVTKIDKTAFEGASFKKVYITRNITDITQTAFKNCENLETVYLTDNITKMTDKTFPGCDNYKTLYILGCQDPEYAYAEGGVAGVKIERLMTHADDKKVIVISGSSSLYGLNTPQLTEELNNEYTVINLGIHANTPAVFFMDLAAAYCKEGDLIINAPEPMHEQWGSVSFNSTMWGILECCLGAVSKVDISQYDGFYSTFASFNQTRSWFDSGRGYDWNGSNSDHYGDLNYERPLQKEDWVTYVNGIQDFSISSCHNKKNIKNFNYGVQKITESGATALLSFSPINVNILSDASRKKDYRINYQRSADEKFDSILISKLDDYIMSGAYFSNTDLHPNTPGTEIRTHKLAEDIKAYLADPASYN